MPAQGASRAAAAGPRRLLPPCGWRTRRIDSVGEPLNLDDIRNALKSLMWRNVGVRRDAEGLAEAEENINHWCGYVLARQFADPTGWELQNMLCVARLMIRAALERLREPRRPRPHRFPGRWTTGSGTATSHSSGNGVVTARDSPGRQAKDEG